MEQITAEMKVAREKILELKSLIKSHAKCLRLLKRCRRTVHDKLPNRFELVEKMTSWTGRNSFTFDSCLHGGIDTLKNQVTVLHLLYGELRGKPHDVREPEQYSHDVEQLRKGLL